MAGRLFRHFVVAMMGLALAGCGWIGTLDPLRVVEKDLGVPVIEAGRVMVGSSEVTFYRYQKGNQCGTGHLTRGGGASGSSGPCLFPSMALPSVTIANMGSGQVLITIYAEVNDPSIVKVTITLEDGTEIPAQVSRGMYFAAYMKPERGNESPKVVRVQGFDKDGKEAPSWSNWMANT